MSHATHYCWLACTGAQPTSLQSPQLSSRHHPREWTQTAAEDTGTDAADDEMRRRPAEMMQSAPTGWGPAAVDSADMVMWRICGQPAGTVTWSDFGNFWRFFLKPKLIKMSSNLISLNFSNITILHKITLSDRDCRRGNRQTQLDDIGISHIIYQ